MNKLDALIAELCPQGVERKRLGDIGVVVRGNGLQKKDFTESGVGCIHYGQIYTYYGTCTYKTKSFVSHELAEKLQKVNKGDLVIAVTSENVEDVGKCVVWLGDEQIVTGAHAAIFRHNQDPKYVAYWFQTNDFFTQKKRIAKGTKVIDLTPQKLEEVTMPVPPLPVQREIVQILDNFTELTEEITEKLTAELTARKKQYEYYRDTLLTFGVHGGGTFEAKWRALGEVCGLQAGKAIPAIEISPVQTKEYSVPCYGGNGLRGYVRTANQQGDKPLVGRQGALCGNVCYATGSYYTTEHAVVVSDKGFFNSRFLYHALVHANLNQYKTAGAQPGLSVAKLEKVKIPVPEKEIQDRIAKVLDNFDAICSDLNIGLPAEIEARKKQYEYYRDMLLTFAAADDIILTDRQTDSQTVRQTDRQSIIKLLQYVFGYVKLPLKDIATEIYRGAGITRDQVTESGIPCVRYGEIYTTYNVWFNECVSHTDESKILSKKYFEHGDVLFAITGEKVEDIAKSCVYMGNERCLAGGDIVIMKHEQNPKYMGYALSTTDAQEQKSKGRVKSKVVHSNVPAISEIIVPLPSPQKQAEIVEILDRFNEICNDLTTGLPAEIEARQKQYEYYRDKLLTFKELGA